MKLTRQIIDNPILGYVLIIFTITFGFVMLTKLPVQLTPDISYPEIKVSTTWRAAAPEEVEAEIIEPQEEAFKGMPGVVSMLSEASQGRGSVALKFELGYSIERALIDVLNRLNQVNEYPVDADNPNISTVGDQARPIAWFIIKPAVGKKIKIAEYKRFVEDTVQARFERIWGVSLSEVRGGRNQEIRISVDPYKAASHGIDLTEAVALISGRSDISGGIVEVGKRNYTVRFEGALDPQTFAEMILAWREGKPVRLRDIAEVGLTYADKSTFVLNNGGPALAVNAYQETGVNVIEVMKDLKQVVAQLGEGPLKKAGLTIKQVYDETVYIRDSIEMLLTNLLLGILLATGILWWFARRFRMALIVAMSIPIALFATIIVLQITGRTLNVISLAALALAVGMVLDASIIVIENILRLREKGLSFVEAAIQGSEQIKVALMATTVTTLIVFLPIAVLEDEAGQLFADLAIGLSAAISVSLVVALILIPMLSQRWLKEGRNEDVFAPVWERITRFLMKITNTRKQRYALITLLFSIPIILSVLLLPKADYLPAGQRNLVFAFLLPPPGVNIQTMRQEMGDVVVEKLQKHVDGKEAPGINHYFFVAFPSGAFMGASAKDPKQINQLKDVVSNVFSGFPDTFTFARVASLFSQGNTRTIEMNLQSRDIDSLLKVAYLGYGLIQQSIPGARVNPKPGLELAESRLTLTPKEEQIVATGWDYARVGLLSRAVGDGVFVDDYFDGDKKIDILARIVGWTSPDELKAIPVITPKGLMVPFGDLVDVNRTAGPDKIRRMDRRRTITLEVIAPPFLPLEVTNKLLKTKVVPILQQQLPEDGQITYSGSADKLKTLLGNMSGAFLLAVFSLFLIIATLFRSFRDSLLVIIALPLAIVGSIVMLKLVNLIVFQPMDMLTMIGFVILLGLVVNNAILLVHQTRTLERSGSLRKVAVEQAIRMRLRPIFMSTLTSLFGILPLLFSLGAGTELYRGLAAVIVGGLLISTIFTLVLLPCLLRIGEEASSN